MKTIRKYETKSGAFAIVNEYDATETGRHTEYNVIHTSGNPVFNYWTRCKADAVNTAQFYAAKY